MENPDSGEACRFGWKLLSDQKELLNQLERALIKFVSYYSSVSSDNSPKHIQLQKVFNAMSLWLKDDALKQPESAAKDFPAVYDTFRLQTCMDGMDESAPWSGLWLDLTAFETAAFFGSTSTKLVSSVSSSSVKRSREWKHVPIEPLPNAPSTEQIMSVERLDLSNVEVLMDTLCSVSKISQLLKKANDFLSAAQSLVLLDSEYLDLVKNLYQNKTRYADAALHCSSLPETVINTISPLLLMEKKTSCAGPAVFEYSFSEAVMDSSVEDQLEKNRLTASNVNFLDLVDHTSCIQSLEVQFAIEWMCRNSEIPRVKRIAVGLFKHVMDLLFLKSSDCNFFIEDFPPLKHVLDLLIPALAESFISRVPAELESLVNRFVDPSSKLCPVYRPMVFDIAKLVKPELMSLDCSAFLRLFDQTCEKAPNMGFWLASGLSCQFDLLKWQEFSDSPIDAVELLKLCDILLDRLEISHAYGPLDCTQSLALAGNLSFLSSLFLLLDMTPQLLELVTLVFKRCRSAQLPLEVCCLINLTS